MNVLRMHVLAGELWADIACSGILHGLSKQALPVGVGGHSLSRQTPQLGRTIGKADTLMGVNAVKRRKEQKVNAVKNCRRRLFAVKDEWRNHSYKSFTPQ